MSERVDWRAIAGWSTFVAVQVGTAIYDWMKTENEQDLETELRESAMRFEMKCRATLRDESIRGFRMWLICDFCSYLGGNCHMVVQSPVPIDGNWEEWAKEEPTSVLMVVKCPTPYRRQLLILRRYSLINSKINVDVAHVNYEYGWRHFTSTYLDDRSVALLFERNDDGFDHLSAIMMVLIDVQQRSQWQVEISPPPHTHEIAHVSRGGSHGNRLRLVYVRFLALEFITVDYDLVRLDVDPSRFVAVERSQQSIVFPNRRLSGATLANFGIRGAAATSLEGVEGASSLIICIDARGDLHGWPADEWNRNFEESDFGQRLFSAGNDFSPMFQMGAITVRSYLRHKFMLGQANNIFFQRPLYVPSMGRLAAEAICRARPDADFSTLESEIGFDIFDGIIRDQEKPVLTTTLL